MSRRPDRPIYCGNYEYEMLETEIKRMFEEYGDVDRIDMKTFCFVYMKDEYDAERAIRKLDSRPVGRRQRPLRVQWAKTRDVDRARDVRPSTSLFVVNFDVARTREREIERHFAPYGRIQRVEIKKNSYAFVQYERIEDAEYAMKKCHLSQLGGRTITVEYVQNEDPGPREGTRDRDRDRRDDGPRRRSRSSPRRRSRSPARRRSPSPARGRDRSPRDRSGSPPRARDDRAAADDADDRDKSRDRVERKDRDVSRERNPADNGDDRGRSPARSRSRSRDRSVSRGRDDSR